MIAYINRNVNPRGKKLKLVS